MNSPKVYFPNLDGLRFIAVTLVIIHHIEQFRFIFGMNSYWGSIELIETIGNIGVKLFFVLSGFLITYLLLTEDKYFGKINVKNFYIRRILRIWPLYFLIIFLAFFILPNISFFSVPGFDKSTVYNDFFNKFLLYLFFLPNLAIVIYGILPYASQTWSIGTEEQYYLIWPVLFKYIKNHRFTLMIFIIITYSIIRLTLYSDYLKFITNIEVIAKFWSLFSIDCMAIGGVFALMLFNKNTVLPLFHNKIALYVSVLLTAFFAFIGASSVPLFQSQFYSVLFGIIILNLCANQNPYILLSNKFISYMGKISYGMYIYHVIAIVASLKIALLIDMQSSWFIYVFSFALTTLFSAFSYAYFEKIFLTKKNKFSTITSL